MKQVLLSLAVAGALLTVGIPGSPDSMPLGSTVAKADGGFSIYFDKGGHWPIFHKKHHRPGKYYGGKHYRGKHYRGKHHGSHIHHHRGEGYDDDHYGRHAHKRHKKHRRHKRRHYVDSCHAVRKDGYWRGHYALIGGTMCYDRRGRAYIVSGSRYLIRYY